MLHESQKVVRMSALILARFGPSGIRQRHLNALVYLVYISRVEGIQSLSKIISAQMYLQHTNQGVLMLFIYSLLDKYIQTIVMKKRNIIEGHMVHVSHFTSSLLRLSALHALHLRLLEFTSHLFFIAADSFNDDIVAHFISICVKSGASVLGPEENDNKHTRKDARHECTNDLRVIV